MRTDRDAVPFLMAKGLTQKVARTLLKERDGTDWRIEELTHERGKPCVLRRVRTVEAARAGGSTPDGDGNNPPPGARANRGDSELDFRRPLPARTTEMPARQPAPDAAPLAGIISVAESEPPGPPAAEAGEEVDDGTAATVRAALARRRPAEEPDEAEGVDRSGERR